MRSSNIPIINRKAGCLIYREDVIFSHSDILSATMKKALTIILILLSSSLACANSLENLLESSSSKLTLFGESHIDDDSRDLLADSLVIYKVNGGINLALEMIESNHQYLLDNYSNDLEGSTEALEEYLDVRWQYNTSSYMYLIGQARDLKLNLLAIDLSKKLWPVETTVFPVIPDVSKVRAAREAHMAKVLCDQKFIKTIVLIGSFHTFKRFLPKALVEECSVISESYHLQKTTLL